MTPTDLDDQIRDVVVTLARSAPEPMAFGNVVSRQTSARRSAERSPRRGVVAATLAFGLVAAIVGSVLWLQPGGSRHPASSDTRPVVHEVVEYSQRADITCPTGTPDVTGQFDRMTFETWGDEANGKYRMQVTYPDGTTRDVLNIGSPYYPERIFTRGVIKGRQLGCNESVGTLQYEPGQGSIWSLKPLTAIPHTADGETKVPQYDDLGIEVPGVHKDSRGRLATLWRQTVTGATGIEGGAIYGVRQVTEWFVDPSSHRVMEQRWHEHLDQIGDAWSVRTLLRRDTVARNPGLFADAGYDEVVIDTAPPSPPTTASSSTIPRTSP